MNLIQSNNSQYYPANNSYQASSGSGTGYGYSQDYYQGQPSSYNYGRTSASSHAFGDTAGSTYPSYNQSRTNSTHCMGQCNPSKLYADTFSYLTENLMKPVIEEVYQDLKSITAANTIANDSAASKMGLNPVQGQAGSTVPVGTTGTLQAQPVNVPRGMTQQNPAGRQTAYNQSRSVPQRVPMAYSTGTPQRRYGVV